MPKRPSSVSIPLRCTTCGHRGRTVSISPGQTVNCPVCDERLIVPAPPVVPGELTVTTPPSSETTVVAAGPVDTAALAHALDCRD